MLAFPSFLLHFIHHFTFPTLNIVFFSEESTRIFMQKWKGPLRSGYQRIAFFNLNLIFPGFCVWVTDGDTSWKWSGLIYKLHQIMSIKISCFCYWQAQIVIRSIWQHYRNEPTEKYNVFFTFRCLLLLCVTTTILLKRNLAIPHCQNSHDINKSFSFNTMHYLC